MSYTPNYWKFVKITNGDRVLYKVLGHWIGGFAEGDSWRLNSGIERVEHDSELDCYVVYGYSGSVYNCYADSEHISGYMYSLLDSLCYRYQDSSEIQIEFIDVLEYLDETNN